MKFWFGVLAAIGSAALVAYLIWGMFLGYVISMAPANVWWWKPLCVVAVGYFGGIAIPLMILFMGMAFVAKCL
jgi:hypothetical protein